MARQDSWLAEQRKVIDNGTAVAKIVLEAPDGAIAGTWSVGASGLDESVEGMLQGLREGFPRGKHQCKLISFDSSGNQLSFLPLTVVGASEAATEAAQGRLVQERSNALMISNCESMMGVQARLIDSMAEAQAALLEAQEQTQKRLDELSALTHAEQVRLVKEQGRQERLTMMMQHFQPLLEVGLKFASMYAGSWIEKQSNKAEPEKQPIPSPPTAQTLATQSAPETAGNPPTESVGSHDETGVPPRTSSSVESPSPCDSGGHQESSEPRSDGERRVETDLRRPARGTRNKAPRSPKGKR